MCCPIDYKDLKMKALERLELFLFERTCIACFLHQEYIMRYSQYAEARCYPKKRCLGFDFKFNKFRIKQGIFIKDIFLTFPVLMFLNPNIFFQFES